MPDGGGGGERFRVNNIQKYNKKINIWISYSQH